MSFIFKFKSNNGVYTLFNGAYSFVIETSKYTIVDCAKLTDADLLTLAQDVFAGYITTLHLVSFYSYLQLRLIAGSSSTGSSTTDALPEGSTNLYFTNGRAVSALTASLLSNLTPTVNPQSGTSYTVGTVGTDNDGKTILRMDNAAANTATITTAQTMPISIRQAGIGATTIVAGAGVTLNGAAVFTAQHQTKTVYRVSAGIYDIVG